MWIIIRILVFSKVEKVLCLIQVGEIFNNLKISKVNRKVCVDYIYRFVIVFFCVMFCSVFF